MILPLNQEILHHNKASSFTSLVLVYSSSLVHLEGMNCEIFEFGAQTSNNKTLSVWQYLSSISICVCVCVSVYHCIFQTELKNSNQMRVVFLGYHCCQNYKKLCVQCDLGNKSQMGTSQ